jgi:exodeoxyribonuclease V
MSEKFEFNDQQKSAIKTAVDWFKGWQDRKHTKQVFFLAGFAGTGKTSIAQTIAGLCAQSHRVVFIAPTGKAASRLRQKGCKNAKTLHQFIYNVRGEDEDGDPIFVGKGALEESPLLVILDEASMVGEYDQRQLLSHRIPILALGDIGQIPPVKASAAYTESNVDVLLTDIERQNADSNIVRASMFVRDGKRLPVREYDDVRVRDSVTDADLVDHSDKNSQVLCSFNNTRIATNRKIRWALGFGGDLPMIGEKVVCTFNQHGYNFMNGEQGIVKGFGTVPDSEREDDDEIGMLIELESLTDGKIRKVKFNPLSFDKDFEVRTAAMKSVGGFDFGYALTIHKAQGSEWENVLILEEIMRGNDYSKMMYTAITRAISRLTIIRDGKA